MLILLLHFMWQWSVNDWNLLLKTTCDRCKIYLWLKWTVSLGAKLSPLSLKCKMFTQAVCKNMKIWKKSANLHHKTVNIIYIGSFFNKLLSNWIHIDIYILKLSRFSWWWWFRYTMSCLHQNPPWTVADLRPCRFQFLRMTVQKSIIIKYLERRRNRLKH